MFPGEIICKFRGEFSIKILCYIYLNVFIVAYVKGIQMWNVAANISI
jgi:hypothetical protein